jgi:hypothetical protein
MSNKCDSNALGIAIAALSVLGMLLLSILGLAGYALEAVKMMQAHHIFFDLTLVGVIAGLVEAGIAGYVIGYLIALFYNKAAK